MKRRDDRDEEVKPIARQIEQLARAPLYAPRGYRIGDYAYQCKSESAEFNLRLRYDMRISVIIFSPTENGPRRLRLTLVCSFSIIILDSDSIKTLGRE